MKPEQISGLVGECFVLVSPNFLKHLFRFHWRWRALGRGLVNIDEKWQILMNFGQPKSFERHDCHWVSAPSLPLSSALGVELTNKYRSGQVNGWCRLRSRTCSRACLQTRNPQPRSAKPCSGWRALLETNVQIASVFWNAALKVRHLTFVAL